MYIAWNVSKVKWLQAVDDQKVKVGRVKIPDDYFARIAFVYNLNRCTDKYTTSSYCIHTSCIGHKGCLITFYVTSDETHPGKAPRKIMYIFPVAECTW